MFWCVISLSILSHLYFDLHCRLVKIRHNSLKIFHNIAHQNILLDFFTLHLSLIVTSGMKTLIKCGLHCCILFSGCNRDD